MTNPPWDVMVATCPSRTSLAKIANKWTAMIVIALSDGPLRFGAVREAVDGISGKVLTETLRDLERDGIVTRTMYNEMPPRVEYHLTPLGRTLEQPLTALGRWAEAHIEDVLRAREDFDHRGLTPHRLTGPSDADVPEPASPRRGGGRSPAAPGRSIPR